MPASVELSPLFDPILDRVGFPLDHPYIERVYCSVLGPTSVLLLRRAGELLHGHPEGVTVDLVDLSRSLGVGLRSSADDVGRNSPVLRSMDRLARFHLATWLGESRFGVHPKVPALAKHRAARLAEPVQSVHRSLLTEHLGGLVARAEGREMAAGTGRPPVEAAGAAVRSEVPGRDVAARLRAFGTNGHDPRAVTR